MLILKGGEFIATEALNVNSLLGLMGMARRRPLLLNGLELHAQDFARLIGEAERTGQPVWPQMPDSEMACSASGASGSSAAIQLLIER